MKTRYEQQPAATSSSGQGFEPPVPEDLAGALWLQQVWGNGMHGLVGGGGLWRGCQWDAFHDASGAVKTGPQCQETQKTLSC